MLCLPLATPRWIITASWFLSLYPFRNSTIPGTSERQDSAATSKTVKPFNSIPDSSNSWMIFLSTSGATPSLMYLFNVSHSVEVGFCSTPMKGPKPVTYMVVLGGANRSGPWRRDPTALTTPNLAARAKGRKAAIQNTNLHIGKPALGPKQLFKLWTNRSSRDGSLCEWSIGFDKLLAARARTW